MSTDSLEELKARNYPAKIEFDKDDALFVVDFPDLPGCSATGATVPEAYAQAEESKAEWLRLAMQRGLPIPEPSLASDYSGRVLLRLPSSLHAILADRAKLRGASLNQYLVHLLSAATVSDELKESLSNLEARLEGMGWQIAGLRAEVGHLTQQMTQKPAVATTAITPTQGWGTGRRLSQEPEGLFTGMIRAWPELLDLSGQRPSAEDIPVTTSKLNIGERGR